MRPILANCSPDLAHQIVFSHLRCIFAGLTALELADPQNTVGLFESPIADSVYDHAELLGAVFSEIQDIDTFTMHYLLVASSRELLSTQWDKYWNIFSNFEKCNRESSISINSATF